MTINTNSDPKINTNNDSLKICTQENPAPKGDAVTYFGTPLSYKWNPYYEHPDATGRCINEDYDDWKYNCPHCKCYWIYEGSDA